MNRKTKLFLIIILIVAFFAAFLLVENAKAYPPALKVWILDVGQGDSIFIKTPQNNDILIDGGPDKKVLEELGEILPFWDRKIDLVILTHPNADHLNGLVEVIKRYKVRNILEPVSCYNIPAYLQWKKIIEEKNITKITAQQGEKIILDSGITMHILWPPYKTCEEIDDINNVSVVAQLSYKNIDFLFTGDATSEVENGLAFFCSDSDIKECQKSFRIEFLKVAHHGSRYSSPKNFLEKIKPLVSLISVGKNNSYHHPHQETLKRLKEIGSRVLRTDVSGRIKIEVKGDNKWEVRCEKRCG